MLNNSTILVTVVVMTMSGYLSTGERAGAQTAIDPVIGTWKLVPTQSTRGAKPPRQAVESYRELDGDRIELSGTITAADGSVSRSRFDFPARGGVLQVRELPAGMPTGMSYVETWIGPGEWYMTAMLEGRQVATRHKVVAKDRKSMRQTVRTVDPTGRPIDQTEVYTRE